MAEKKIIAVRSSALSLYDDGLNGFKNRLKVQKIDYSLEVVVLPDAPDLQDALMARIESEKPDLILTLGSAASRTIRAKIKDIPSVFCMLLDPAVNDLMYGGVSLDVKPQVQIDYIRKNFPQFKRIGLIFNPQRMTRTVDDYKEIRQSRLVDMTMVEVTAIELLEKAVLGLTDKVDCILMLSDSSLYTPQTAAQTILQTLQRGVPIVTASPALVKGGAMAGIYADTQDNGYVAGSIAIRVFSGENIEDIPLQWPATVKTSINLVVATRLKVAINKATLEEAEQVIK